eukprot:3496138-Ditylum_brightwellii.AAC.1
MLGVLEEFVTNLQIPPELSKKAPTQDAEEYKIKTPARKVRSKNRAMTPEDYVQHMDQSTS